MAMFPALMNDTMFSDLFDDPFFEGWRNTDSGMSAVMPANMMSTDVRETDKGYDVDIDMPGMKKEDINLELNNGYLTVSATRSGEHEDKSDDAQSENGKWLRRERYAGSCSRSFYVGDQVKESDIHASYNNGTLCVQVPKMQAAPQVESKHQIAIEG
ncbi:molecular chaperone Hsp20 [Bifidobacterium sp. UTCIF-37]|uniref:Hsp20 family heat shock chaperone n=1 Tax=Bifidobacterium callitrichos DSM 23973 TaxID=1437609 RepID=A0A086ZTM0_9BIFI|nr:MULTISPECIES: Hsp20/alpha crystallin family protein [Bifidobacterium]KFI49870.1 Hsp20 family heat shock chaperone [Bifidobacterium callitrichos DSM 23973]TPF85343.1 molecular chaperone Hsp20 [Bifidobacterium sp. UTCIF-37]TPF87129.1 molecular chaperone Hsp20 [Bifidobacterium sp. UTCIF-38]